MLDLGTPIQSTAEAARWMHQCGFQSVVIEENSKKPKHNDWPNRNFTPEDFTERSNIGLKNGEPSGGLMCLDIDCPEGVKAIAFSPNLLPATYMIDGRKGSPDSHWWYITEDAKTEKLEDPDGVTGPDGKASFLELRWTGLQTVIPPSRHESGEIREWKSTAVFKPEKVNFDEIRRKAYYLAAVCLVARRWPNGGHNDFTLDLAGGLAHGGMEEREAEKFISLVCRIAEDEKPQKRLDTINATYEKFRNGEITTGIPVLKERFGEKAYKKLELWLGLKRPLDQERQYEDGDPGNAKRFALRWKGKVKYDFKRKLWLIWNGKRWAPDETGQILLMAEDVRNDLLTEMSMARSETVRDTLMKEYRKLGSLSRIKAMLELAQSEPDIAATANDFDQDPWLLNCRTCTIDLRTACTYPHRKEDYITKLAPVDYDPGAKCPLWVDLFAKLFDLDVTAYIQKAAGWALTGDTSEKKLFIFHGKSANNGKSTVLNTVKDILGPDYACNVAPETVLQAEKGGKKCHSEDVARLAGKRLVTIIEVDRGEKLAIGLLKQMTGGSDSITARNPFERSIEFKPTHKIFFATNNKPRPNENTQAVWDRVKLVHFNKRFGDAEELKRGTAHYLKDLQFGEKLKAEYSGILNWLIQGCLLWQKEGLIEPETVRQDTEQYRDEMDIIGDFFSESCMVDPEGEILTKELYQVYFAWCQSNNEKPLGKQNFNSCIEDRGGIKVKGHGNKPKWKGIRLSNGTDEESPPAASENSHNGKQAIPENDPLASIGEDFLEF